MPRLTRAELRRTIVDAFTAAGFKVQSVTGAHPHIVSVTSADGPESFTVYVWNVTHGGATRDPSEFRIQVTGVTRLQAVGDSRVLLLGVLRTDDGATLIVAFDPQKHATFGASPSIQVHTPTLNKARQRGIGAERKELAHGGNEMVFALLPENLGQYIRQLSRAYHEGNVRPTNPEGRQVEQLDFSTPNLSEEDLVNVPRQRKRVLLQVNQWMRDQKFRRRVLHVYAHKCAVCGLQAKLVQGSHISAVHRRGTDDVKNGIALCVLHHAAFDCGLLAIGEDFVIRANRPMIEALRQANLHGGLNGFLQNSRIGERIYLPNDRRYQPEADFLRQNLDLKGRHNFN